MIDIHASLGELSQRVNVTTRYPFDGQTLVIAIPQAYNIPQQDSSSARARSCFAELRFIVNMIKRMVEK